MRFLAHFVPQPHLKYKSCFKWLVCTSVDVVLIVRCLTLWVSWELLCVMCVLSFHVTRASSTNHASPVVPMPLWIREKTRQWGRIVEKCQVKNGIACGSAQLNLFSFLVHFCLQGKFWKNKQINTSRTNLVTTYRF